MVAPSPSQHRDHTPRVGVLALQGDFSAHACMVARCGGEACEVRKPSDLRHLDGLILPGGESTTMLRLMSSALSEGLRNSILGGLPTFATCAGTILLASTVLNPTQKSLNLLGITVERNGFGRQKDSFIASKLEWNIPTIPSESEHHSLQVQEAVFIRAPRIVRCDPNVEVLARWKGEPVLVRQGAIVAATFHPELSGDFSAIHCWFLQQLGAAPRGYPTQVAVSTKLCSDTEVTRSM